MSEAKKSAYESYTLQPTTILVTGVALTALIVGALAFVAAVLPPLEQERMAHEAPLHPMSGSREKPPAPLLQADPYAELEQHALEVDRRIRTYGWIERQSDVIHIPVERAMELVVERGLPALSAPRAWTSTQTC